MDVVSQTEASSSSWNATGLSATTLEALDNLNFPFPTPIQSAVIPPAVKLRKDIIGAAETWQDSRICYSNSRAMMEDLLFALIISPTRELAVQIKDVFKALSAKIGPRPLKVVAIVGGMSEQKQHRLLKSRPDVIVATPGRLWALRQTGAEYLADLSALRILVVDEIDRMLEQGHFEELRHIVQDIHRAKKEQKIRKSVGSDELKSAVGCDVSAPPLQTLIFSATLTFTHHIPLRRGEKAPQSSMDSQQKVRRIAHSMCMRKGSAHLSVVDLTPPQKTPQTLIECRMNCADLLQKDSNLLYVLKRYGGRTLKLAVAKTSLLHGRMKERERLKSVDKFKESDDAVLLATDVAARGLDFHGGYIHRSGRTARASNAGLSVLFVDPLDLHHYLKICRNLNKEEDLELLAMDAPKLMESCRMEATYVKHWKKRRTLEVGHRGSGESFTKFATARENTIFSLNNAAQKGADFVEFDVQLSRDQSVVVFHDFHVLVSVAKRNPQRLEPNGLTTTNNSIKSATEVGGPTAAATTDGGELHKMAVRDLSLAQLRLLHVHHYLETEERDKISHPPHKHHHLTGEPDEGSDFRSFPTLVEALQRVDEHAGFNVEIKYPMKMRDGTHECENYFERNQYMDRLLMDVFGHAGKRRVVFSSFDPDICTLLSVKQNRYPVLFLCVGQTDRYVPFLDERSKVTRVGTNFSACSNLLGINLHSEELLSDPTPLGRAVALKLIVFVWGEDLDNPVHVAYFRRQNVDAIIYDRIGELETRQNVFVVEREVKSALFKSPRSSPSLSRANSLQRNSPSPTTVEEPNRPPAKMLANGFARQMTIANGDY
uniref:RNA helicase n=1 Tax=Globodera pallida TaxID=36090 RepID=A0A183BM61_GLOPA